MNAPQLSKYEIACITAGVPATGDPLLDQIITTGLRYRTATEILGHLSHLYPMGQECSYDALAAQSVDFASALLKQFVQRAGGEDVPT